MKARILEVAPHGTRTPISRGSRICRNVPYLIEGIHIIPKGSLKYLDTVLGSRLSFNEHVKYVMNKTNSRTLSHGVNFGALSTN